ncbi:MAG TPA: bifunctional adenosylcobinamide kinase/adenosylcobinamide-phosphate guanylyltransferase [Anaerolineaceae bacterium]|nr:bifunctional adenosylcobinamide kinase/adenosylcobinamide-phosphate guanylyltransferase [Anaerolineaceae bacterium]
MGRLTLILGGARSGKSTFAGQLALESGKQVAYVATARALDTEMEKRIAVHQRERPGSWTTLEIPSRLGSLRDLLPSSAQLVLVDCLTMLATNILLDVTEDVDHPDEEAATARMAAEIADLAALVQDSPWDWIIVSNEVGLGLVPPYPLGRIFRDLLGWANQRLAARADEVYWLVAGIPVPIHPFRQSQITEG